MRNITGTLIQPDGTLLANREITFTLVSVPYNRPISNFIAATKERVIEQSSVITDVNGAFSISLVENTLMIDASAYLVEVQGEGTAFVAALDEGVTDVDWMDFKYYGQVITPAELDLIQQQLDIALGYSQDSLDSANASEASATASQLSAWESAAEYLTAQSYAIEAENVFVKSYTSNGDGTFTASDTTDYSAFHYSSKSSTSATASSDSAILSEQSYQNALALYGSIVAVDAAVAAAQAAAVQTGLDVIAADQSASDAAASEAVVTAYASSFELNSIYNIKLAGEF